MSVQAYTKAREATFVDNVVAATMAEARALIAGASPELAAEIGARTAGSRPRKVGPMLNQERVSERGYQLPSGQGCAGSLTKRNNGLKRLRAVDYQHRHAHYIDTVRKCMTRLEMSYTAYTRASCRKRKKLYPEVKRLATELQSQLERVM